MLPPRCPMSPCPVCHAPMHAETLDGVPIAVCAAHGTWLDHGELLQITDVERYKPVAFWEQLFRREVFPPRRDGRVLACPTCGTDMLPIEYHHVFVDWCGAHGVWLDAGEMEAILNNLRTDPAYLRGFSVRLADGRF